MELENLSGRSGVKSECRAEDADDEGGLQRCNIIKDLRVANLFSGGSILARRVGLVNKFIQVLIS